VRYIGFGIPLGAWLGGDGLVSVGGRRVSMPTQVYYVWTILNSCPLESELGETGISRTVLDYALKVCLNMGVAVISEEGDEWRHIAGMRVIPQAYPAVSEKHGSPPTPCLKAPRLIPSGGAQGWGCGPSGCWRGKGPPNR